MSADKTMVGMVDGPDGKKIPDVSFDSVSEKIDRIDGKIKGLLDIVQRLKSKLDVREAGTDWNDTPATSTPIEDIKKQAASHQMYPAVGEFNWDDWLQSSQSYEKQLLDIKNRLLNSHKKLSEEEIYLCPLVEAAIHRERFEKAKVISADTPASMQAWNECLRELEKAADILAESPKLKNFTYTNKEGLEIQMQHWAVRHLVASLKNSIGDAKNFTTMELTLTDRSESFIVTIQRKGHETPAEQRNRSLITLDAIMKLVNAGKTVSFSEDSGGNTLTVSVNARHSHVGTHDCTLQELADQLHGLLVEGRGLSWHDDTEMWKHTGHQLIELIRELSGTDKADISDDLLQQAASELRDYESMICEIYLPTEDRSDERSMGTPDGAESGSSAEKQADI